MEQFQADQGNIAEEVSRLKQQFSQAITILGSSELVRTLMHHHLIDEYLLVVCPLVLGQGQAAFSRRGPNDAATGRLQGVQDRCRLAYLPASINMQFEKEKENNATRHFTRAYIQRTEFEADQSAPGLWCGRWPNLHRRGSDPGLPVQGLISRVTHSAFLKMGTSDDSDRQLPAHWPAVHRVCRRDAATYAWQPRRHMGTTANRRIRRRTDRCCIFPG